MADDTTTKTWEIYTHDGKVHSLTGTRVEVHSSQARTTFYNGDEVVGSFVGLNGFVKTS